jgi:hypothetical protein
MNDVILLFLGSCKAYTIDACPIGYNQRYHTIITITAIITVINAWWLLSAVMKYIKASDICTHHSYFQIKILLK